MLCVEEINSIEELASHRGRWADLLAAMPAATFFHTFDWLEVYWRHFGAGQRLRALVVRRDGQVQSILPLVVCPESTRVGRVRVLTWPLHDWGTFYGPIGGDAETFSAALEHLRATQRDWDFFDLRWMALDEAGRAAEAAMTNAGWKPKRQAWAEGAVAELDGDWSGYWRGRAKKFRHNVERIERRLRGTGRVEFVRYRPDAAEGRAAPRLELMHACCQVATRSWQGHSTNGTTLCHGAVQRFLQEVHVAAAGMGALDVNLLTLDDRPVAFAYNYVWQGSVFGLRMGFDRDFQALGPGLVLQRLALEDSFRRGDRLYDFGICYLECKRPWMTRPTTSYRMTYFPPGLSRTAALRLKRWLVDWWYGERYVVCAKIG